MLFQIGIEVFEYLVEHLGGFGGQQAQQFAVVEVGAPGSVLVTQRMAFMRYEGQGHEIEIPLPLGPVPDDFVQWLQVEFDRIYEENFGRTVPNVDLEVMNWGFIAATPARDAPPIPSPRATRKPAPDGTRKIYWGQNRRKLEVCYYERGNLNRGHRINGPALIVETQTTTLVGPEFDAVIDAVGNIVMKRRARVRSET